MLIHQAQSIKSVRHWLIQITILLSLTSLLTGCFSLGGLFEKEKVINVQTEAVEKTHLDIEEPAPLDAKPIGWIIITRENAEEVFAQLEAEGKHVVLFGLTSDDYRDLSLTIADLRTILVTQKEIIVKYKEYYESNEDGK